MANKLKQVAEEKKEYKRYADMTPEEERVVSFIGQTFKGLREERQLSQPQLAKLSGISQTTITQIETAKRPPSLRTIIRLAKFFNYDLELAFEPDKNYDGFEGRKGSEK